MTEAQYGTFLSFGAWVCALGAVFNLFKLKRRGNSALLLSSAFLALGAVLWTLKVHGNETLIRVLSVLVLGLLIADVVLRSRHQEHQR